MVVIGGFDLLKDWLARHVEALRGKGKPVKVVEHPDAIHGFHVFPAGDRRQRQACGGDEVVRRRAQV